MHTTTGAARSFLGGLNIRGGPGWGARFNAAVPRARLDCRPERLDLYCVWPPQRQAGRAMARDEVVACFRIRPGLLLTFGVGFDLPAGEVAYFWTFGPRAVLYELERLGYPIGPPRFARLAHLFGRRP